MENEANLKSIVRFGSLRLYPTAHIKLTQVHARDRDV
jgi:hypothetical protein